MRLGILFLISLSVFAEKYFPDERWETAESDQVGLDQEKVDKLFRMTFEDEAAADTILGVDIFPVIHVASKEKIFVSLDDIEEVEDDS